MPPYAPLGAGKGFDLTYVRIDLTYIYMVNGNSMQGCYIKLIRELIMEINQQCKEKMKLIQQLNMNN